jgi:hypothetical protein
VEPGFASGAYAYTGGISVSANGTSGGLVWAVTWTGTRTGTLRAFDATNMNQLFQAVVGTEAGYPTPTIANGDVYVATRMRLYGYNIKGLSGCKIAKGAERSTESRPINFEESLHLSK